jgi:PTS system N-acetylglucosamine-specific IIA component
VVGAGVVAWYPDVVEATGRSAVCPVIALDAAIEALSDVRETGEVAPGDPLFSWAR